MLAADDELRPERHRAEASELPALQEEDPRSGVERHVVGVAVVVCARGADGVLRAGLEEPCLVPHKRSRPQNRVVRTAAERQVVPVDAAGRGAFDLDLVEFLLDAARVAGGELQAGDQVE